MKRVVKPFAAAIAAMLLFSGCEREVRKEQPKKPHQIREEMSGGNFINNGNVNGVIYHDKKTDLNYFDSKERPEITFDIRGSDKITNGTATTYSVTVFYKDTRPPGSQQGSPNFPEKITGTVRVFASGITALERTIDVSRNSGTTETFVLSCSPAGRSGTVRTSDGQDTRRGSRICNSWSIVAFPGTPPCPDGCGTRWWNRCPPGCGVPATYKTVSACTDDPSTLEATFATPVITRSPHSASMKVLCIPSEGATQGTL